MIKCPSCASDLKFDIASGMMKCEHCSQAYDPYMFENEQKGAQMVSEDGNAPEQNTAQSPDSGLYETAVFICPSCGAQLTCTDRTDVAVKCAYCGNSNIIFDRIKNERRPNSIIPFMITKEQCKQQYVKASKRAFLSPDGLRSADQIDSFRGIYMPYWDYTVDFENEPISFEAKSKTEKRQGDYLVTTHYHYSGNITAHVSGASHDSSSQFDDNLSERLDPYYDEDKRRFSPAFLNGFYAETGDVGTNEWDYDLAAANARLKVADLARDKQHLRLGSSIVLDNSSIPITKENINASRTMFPVWFMSYRKSDSEMTYATVNGSTGKVVADFPISIVKYLIFSGILAAVFFLLFTFIDLMPRPQTSLSLTGLLAMIGSYLNLKAGIKANRKKNGIGAILARREKMRPGVFLLLFLVFIAYFSSSLAAAFALNSVDGPEVFVFFLATVTIVIIKFYRVHVNAKTIEQDKCFKEPFFKKKSLVYFFAAAVIGIILLVSFDNSAWSAHFISQLYIASFHVVLAFRVLYRNYGFSPKTGKSTLLFVATLLSIAFSVGVLILQPMNEVYYIACVVNAVVFVLGAMDTVIYQNELSYRRPPQFNKTGGDNSAK